MVTFMAFSLGKAIPFVYFFSQILGNEDILGKGGGWGRGQKGQFVCHLSVDG